MKNGLPVKAAACAKARSNKALSVCPVWQKDRQPCRVGVWEEVELERKARAKYVLPSSQGLTLRQRGRAEGRISLRRTNENRQLSAEAPPRLRGFWPTAAAPAAYRLQRPNESANFRPKCSILSNSRNSTKIIREALARWLSWLEHHPVRQKVTDSIPSQSTYLGCGYVLPSLSQVRMRKRQSLGKLASSLRKMSAR